MSETDNIQSCTDKLKLLSDTTRFKVMEQLRGGALSVGELCEKLGCEQSLMSHHLSLLKKGGLVKVETAGKTRLYQIHDQVDDVKDSKSLDLGCCKLDFGSWNADE